jgi:hypothetical protein
MFVFFFERIEIEIVLNIYLFLNAIFSAFSYPIWSCFFVLLFLSLFIFLILNEKENKTILCIFLSNLLVKLLGLLFS